MNWTDAEELCQAASRDAHLVAIETRKEQQFLEAVWRNERGARSVMFTTYCYFDTMVCVHDEATIGLSFKLLHNNTTNNCRTVIALLSGVSTISRFWTAGAMMGGRWSWYIKQVPMTYENWVSSEELRILYSKCSQLSDPSYLHVHV